MVKVKFYFNNEYIGEASVKDSKSKIVCSGPEKEGIEKDMELPMPYYENGEMKKLFAKEDPVEYLVRLNELYTGSYTKASLPEFIDD